MTEYLNMLLDSTNVPVLMAFILGLLTAISPCPLATNITAVGYISRNIESRRKVFLQGLMYTLGRAFAYTILGAVFIYIIRKGADTFEVQQFVSEWGELVIGPVLILVGLFMLFGHLLHLPKLSLTPASTQLSTGSPSPKGEGSYRTAMGALVLGILFAMAFCPTSGLFYFGMLIPMSAEATAGYLLPLVFALATSLPVLLVSWFIAFSMQNLSKFIGSVQTFQKWFNRIVAALFIVVGIYYVLLQTL